MINVVCGVIRNSESAFLYNEKYLVGLRKSTRDYPLTWEFPGGKVENGETPEQALIREMQEELNIQITCGPVLLDIAHPDMADTWIRFYLVTSFQGELMCLDHEYLLWLPRRVISTIRIINSAMIAALHAAESYRRKKNNL